MRALFSLLTLLVLHVSMALAVDAEWPCYRGPLHNGISPEKGILGNWPKDGPKVLWKAKVGIGFSSIAVSGGKVFTLGNQNNKDTIYCFDALTGKEIWSQSYNCDLDPKYYDGGPGATPCVDGEVLYSVSKDGELSARKTSNGEKIWVRNFTEEGFERPDWGFNSSPLIEGNLVIVNAAIAFNKTTGKTVWKSSNERTGYSTPFPIGAGANRFVIVGAGKSYKALNVKDGKELWSFEWDTQYEVNAADPLNLNDTAMFISSGYDKGCALLQPINAQPKAVWQNKTIRTHMSPGLFLNGFIFGLDGNTGGAKNELKCINPGNGQVTWTKTGYGTGGMVGVDGKLLILTERGELVVVAPDSQKYTELARAQIIGGKCWTSPAVTGGRLYARNSAGDLVCVSIKGE